MDINDSELLKLEKVLNWAKSQQESRRDIDQFTKDIREKINHAGFEAEVKVLETSQPGTYAFDVELTGRLDSRFDPDRQVHEVTSNLLELPGQKEGFIPSRDYLDKLANMELKKNKDGPQDHKDCQH